MDKINNSWITQSIGHIVEESPENRLGGSYDEKAWEAPLVGFSKGDDELYQFFKKDIGDFYWTPEEIFRMSFPDTDIKPEGLSVISWILPQTKATKEEQRKEITYPTKRAALARVNGDILNVRIGEYLVDLLTKRGYKALAPMLSPLWKCEWSEKYSNASTWSERHTAFVCGLGTFGLSDALITPVGMAMRCGSIIANIDLAPSTRNYTTYHEYCLYYRTGGCKKCAERCPANAITEKGHDKQKCMAYQDSHANVYIKQEYQLSTRYCGICQFGVPCESQIPAE